MFGVNKTYDLILAAIVAASASYFLEPNFAASVTAELISFFSIQSAVILPAMIFTAGILKPDGLELGDAAKYHKALRTQMTFWIVLLSLDLIVVAFLIIEKVLCWHMPVNIKWIDKQFDFIYLVNFLVVFFGSVAILRTIPFIKGVLSLLELNSEMVRKAIIRRNKLEAKAKVENSEPGAIQMPIGYGSIIEPPQVL